MFQIGDIVVYSNHGVCKVIDIGPLAMNVADKERQYYTLAPLYQTESIIYAPVDNPKQVMRDVISRKQADALIQQIDGMEADWITNEKERERKYKETLKSCDCLKLAKMIKTLHIRHDKRAKLGKRMTVVDERYFKRAEEQLYEELAFVLQIELKNVDSYIRKEIEEGHIQELS